jgi:DNA-nicking Smr family endonuclease
VKLDDLAGLHRALVNANRAKGDAARARRDAAKAQDGDGRGAAPAAADITDADAFRGHVGPVAPLRARERVTHALARPEPVPTQRLRDEREALAASMSDDFDVETLLDTDDSLSFRRPGIGPDVLRRLRRGHWTLQAEIDLHGLTREAAREALAEFVAEASQRGARCVRVVHGKGIGSPGRMPVLKGKVRAWLVQNDRVIAFVQAPPTRGGHGALMVLLA